MNFQKKALALVLAVLMILSSVSALAFAVPKAVNPVQSNKNAAAYINRVDTTLNTIYGSFKNDNTATEAQKKAAYKNLIYSGGVVDGDATNSLTGTLKRYTYPYDEVGHVYANFYHDKDAVLVVDGRETPTLAVLAEIKNEFLKATTHFKVHRIIVRNADKMGMNVDPYWDGVVRGEDHENASYNYYMPVYNPDKDITMSGRPGVTTEWEMSYNGSNLLRYFSNRFTFTGSFADGVYSKTLDPQYNVAAKVNLGEGVGESGSSTNKITVINYKPIIDAVARAKDLATNKLLLYPAHYTVESVNAFKAAVELLDAANPKNFFDNTKRIKDVEGYEAAADTAMKAWNEWDTNPELGGLKEVSLPDKAQVIDETIVLDYALNIAERNVMADVASANNAIEGLSNFRYVGYSANPAEAIDTNVTLSAMPANFIAIETARKYNANMNNGTCTFDAAGNVKFDVDTSKLTFDKTDALYLCLAYGDTECNTYYKVEKVTFVPANSIYVEDDANAFTYGGNITWENSNSAVTESAAKLVGSGEVYGHSEAYANCNTYSAGAAHVATLTQGKNATVKFSFKGTGFDVISVASSDTGAFIIDVKGTDSNVTKQYMMNTFSGWKYVDGQWIQDDTNANVLYQIPAIKITDLPYGNYDVTIKAVYSKAHDGNRDGSYKFIFDGVRIYNPINEDLNSEVKDIYNKDNEANAVYTEFNTILASVGSTKTNGVTITDADGKLIDDEAINMVNKVSPNHELYIAPGHILSFKLNTKATPASVQVGAKLVGGTGTYVTIDGKTRIQTATAMYYKLEESNGVYTIINNGDAVLSLTNIKCTFSEPVAANAVALVADAETPRIAYAVAKAPLADLSVKAQAPVVNDKTVTIKATTSLDVEALNVTDENGNVVDAKAEYTVNGNVKNWTVTIVEAEAGTYSYTISGEYAYGHTNNSAAAKVTVTIEEAEVPAPQPTFTQKVVNFLKKIFGIKF